MMMDVSEHFRPSSGLPAASMADLAVGGLAMAYLRRREFIGLIGGAVTLPLAARAQPGLPVIGFLHPGTAEANAQRVEGFHKGLREAGFVEGRNVAIEFR